MPEFCPECRKFGFAVYWGERGVKKCLDCGYKERIDCECRFCKEEFNEKHGDYYFGNFVCNNCVDIVAEALKRRKLKI